MSEKTLDEIITPVSRTANILITFLAIALTCSAIIRALDIDRMAGLVLYTEQYLSFTLCLALPLVCLAVPAGKGRKRTGRIPWYDVLGALAGFITAAYITIRYPVLSELTTVRPVDGIIVGAIILVLLIEGLRRTVGIVLPIVVIGFFILALVGHHIPGTLQGSYVSLEKLVYYLAWDSSAVLGMPMRIITTVVIAFVLFGQILHSSGGSGFFTDIATVVMGRYRGGPAKISVLSSCLFGTISGSAVANVVVDGVVTIPLMKKGGYPAHIAGAIEAATSTGGQLMPPVMGAAAFLMAEFLSVPYAQVAIAALIPSLLYYLALFMEADLEAAKKGLARVEKALIPPVGPVLKTGWVFPLPFIVLIYALFWWNDLPEKAALRAVAVIIIFGLLFGYKGKRMKISDLISALKETGLGVLEIVMIGAAAGMVIAILYISGLSFGLTLAVTQIAGGSLILLLLVTAVVCTILGMGMPTTGVYVLLAAVAAPALIEFGITPMAAHMFIMYFGMMSMITPPVALAAFAAATIAGADPMRTGYAAMRFGWLAFVIPFLFVISPTLLMQGNALLVAFNFFTAIVGTCLVSMAIVGYFSHRLPALQRLLFAVGGLAAIFPATGLGFSLLVNVIGLVIAIFIFGREFLRRYSAQRDKRS